MGECSIAWLPTYSSDHSSVGADDLRETPMRMGEAGLIKPEPPLQHLLEVKTQNMPAPPPGQRLGLCPQGGGGGKASQLVKA